MYARKTRTYHETTVRERLEQYQFLMSLRGYQIGDAAEIGFAIWAHKNSVYTALQELGLNTVPETVSVHDKHWQQKHHDRWEYIKDLRRIFRHV